MYLRRCFVLIYVNITNLNVVSFSVFYFNNVTYKTQILQPYRLRMQTKITNER